VFLAVDRVYAHFASHDVATAGMLCRRHVLGHSNPALSLINCWCCRQQTKLSDLITYKPVSTSPDGDASSPIASRSWELYR
jgi:hypothetical protein